MKVLVYTTLFPNSKMPNHGVFVKARILQLAKLCDIRVVAPVPYFPHINISKKWYAFSQVPAEEVIDGLKVYHPRYFITPKIFRSLYGVFMFISTINFVKKIKKDFNFDLIDAHFVYPDGLAAVMTGKCLGTKVMVTARGTDINWYTKFRMIRPLVRYVLKNAAHIVSVSSYLKQIMLGLGIDEDKISVIPNGVDTKKLFPIPREQARALLGLPTDKKIILSLGLLIERKGFHYLIDALNLLREKDAVLYVIGEGEWRDKLTGLIKKLHLENRVNLVGEKTHSELYKWYSAADLFCLTSLREGRPNVVLESLACGTPVLSMDKWGLSEIVTSGAGALIDSYEPHFIAQKIDELLKKQWNRNAIAATISSLDWEKTSKDVAGLFNKIISKQDVLFFSSDDWNSGLKTSKYHLATRLARDNRVFFINSIGLRTPSVSASDTKRIFKKLAGFFRGVTKVGENLFVYTPIAIPFQGIGGVRFLNNFIITLQIKCIMAKFGVKRPDIWTFLPNSLGVVNKIPKRKLIYYCVDEMSAFKGVPSGVISKLDEALTKKADAVFAVSKTLYEKKLALNKNAFYSPHGVDFELFNKAITEQTVDKPKDISDITGPIIGFYGLISSDWIDYDLVKFIADKKPDWSFVFVGKIDVLKDAPPKAKNIHYLPVKPYEELYKYSRFFDVAMLPFNLNELTMNSHPLKILEYLSAGKPVVSIAIPEAVKYENVIEIAKDREDFLTKIEKCLKNNIKTMVDDRVNFASLNSWEKRFSEIQKTINNHN
ncbi:MAG: glycosyltransferase [Candidatus Omnitrophota bacterium]